MNKKKRFILTILLTCLVILLTFIWFYNQNIIHGDFDKLTITQMGETIAVIEKTDEINHIINQINESPRTFQLDNSGFRYDYMPHGILIFENDQEKVKIGYIVTTGNIVTKHWEIDANLDFGKDRK